MSHRHWIMVILGLLGATMVFFWFTPFQRELFSTRPTPLSSIPSISPGLSKVSKSFQPPHFKKTSHPQSLALSDREISTSALAVAGPSLAWSDEPTTAEDEPLDCGRWLKRPYLIKQWPRECLQRFVQSVPALRTQALRETPIVFRGPMDQSNQAWNSFIQAHCPTVTPDLLLCQAFALHVYHGIRPDSLKHSTPALNYLQGFRREYWDHLHEESINPGQEISSSAFSFLMNTLQRHQHQRFTPARAAFLNWFHHECQTFRQFMAQEGVDVTDDRVCYPLLYLPPIQLFLNQNLTPHEWEQWDALFSKD